MRARLTDSLLRAAAATTGFLDHREGVCLADAATRAARSGRGPLVEIGGYLGRSTLYLAAGIANTGMSRRLYSIDHHHGSEEMQVGWPHHDPGLADARSGRIDTLGRWRTAMVESGADAFVIGVIGDSADVARDWSTPLSLVFIDGGHGDDVCWGDYTGWAPLVEEGGALIFHDVYPDPADGGRPPYECYLDAVASGTFIEDVSAETGSLRVLVRSTPN
ncbi:MAG TPA: class I SAM-dependent methyltransferase, partial [Acidimicrobiales bacterium]|nr:class I SAM-dependent methyltransferase [Acidimicrobiales bacterium]